MTNLILSIAIILALRFVCWLFRRFSEIIRKDVRLPNHRIRLGDFFMIVLTGVIFYLLYRLYDRALYGDYIGLMLDWSVYATGILLALFSMCLYDGEQLKVELELIKKDLEEVEQKIRLFIQNQMTPLKEFVTNEKNDYLWEEIEAQKETYYIHQALFSCWNQYSPGLPRNRQSNAFNRVVDERGALVSAFLAETKRKIDKICDNFHSLFQSDVLSPSQRSVLANMDVREFASYIDSVASELKVEKPQSDGIPWQEQKVALDIYIKNTDQVMQYAENMANEIRNSIANQDAKVSSTRRPFAGFVLRNLLKKQKKYLSHVTDLFEQMNASAQKTRRATIPFATQLVFNRLRLIEKRAERWELGLEELLELCEGLREENLLDYESIFDAYAVQEIKSKALASSNPRISKYAALIKHFEPDRFFNIELPFPMRASDRKTLETPVFTRNLTNGIENWKTATIKLVKGICAGNPELIVARNTSYLEYRQGQMETIVLVKPVVDRENVALAHGGKKIRAAFDYGSEVDSEAQLEDRFLEKARVELAYVVLRLKISQNKLNAITAHAGFFADPASISPESRRYTPYDFKAGSTNGRYICIGKTRGTSTGKSFGTGASTSTGRSTGSSTSESFTSRNGLLFFWKEYWDVKGSESHSVNESTSESTSRSTNESTSETISENEMWIPDVNSDPNFSGLTENAVKELSDNVQEIVEHILRDGDLDAIEASNIRKNRNRKRYE